MYNLRVVYGQQSADAIVVAFDVQKAFERL